MLSFQKSNTSQGTLVFRGHSVEVLAQIVRPTVLKASVLLMTRNGQLGPDIPGAFFTSLVCRIWEHG